MAKGERRAHVIPHRLAPCVAIVHNYEQACMVMGDGHTELWHDYSALVEVVESAG